MSQPGAKLEERPARKWSPFRLTRFWLIALIISGTVLAVGGSLAAVHWPFRYAKIHPLLEDMFGNRVKIGKYHRVYFPHPGFIATGIMVVRRDFPNSSPVATVETLSMQGAWSDMFLLRHRLRLIEITKLHAFLPGSSNSSGDQQQHSGPQQTQQHSNAEQFDGPKTPVERLKVYNSILDIPHRGGGRYTFAIRELEITDLEKGRQWHYLLDMENAYPDGHIGAVGTFGPLNTKDVGSSPLSGQFTFNHVKLTDLGDLRGTLASTGRFDGVLHEINAQAISDTPDFAVADGQPTPIRGFIRCTINGLNGDVFMQQVEISTGRTIVRAHGQVAGSPKLTNLDVDVDKGRAEEVLRPFIHGEVPVIGPATLHSHAFVDRVGKPFLERLQIKGRFDVPAEKTTDPKTEKSLTDFSRREVAHDHDPAKSGDPRPHGDDVLASLQGPAEIQNGVISSSGLVFRIPGASASLHGTFSLHGEVVHLVGKLKMDASISHAATGWKSILLKPLQPFFHRKDRDGSEIPIAVIGRPGHYQVTQDIAKDK